jgi:hypothetical protein
MRGSSVAVGLNLDVGAAQSADGNRVWTLLPLGRWQGTASKCDLSTATGPRRDLSPRQRLALPWPKSHTHRPQIVTTGSTGLGQLIRAFVRPQPDRDQIIQ